MDEVERIARCVEIKAEVVASDEREGGRRALLNYGHTLAHALETATDHAIAHGEAVAVGLIYAARARPACSVGSTRTGSREHEARRPRCLRPPGRRCRLASTPNELLTLMGRDKKALDGLTFVLDGPHGLEVVPDVPRRRPPARRARRDVRPA